MEDLEVVVIVRSRRLKVKIKELFDLERNGASTRERKAVGMRQAQDILQSPSSPDQGESHEIRTQRICYHYNNVNFGVLDVLKCEHHIAYTKCAECHQKVSTMWLLDSGASAHFTNNKNDFIEYTPASESDRQPIRTAAHTR